MEKYDKARLKAIATDLIMTTQDAKATPEEAIMALSMALGNLVAAHEDASYAHKVALGQVAMAAKGMARRMGKDFRCSK